MCEELIFRGLGLRLLNDIGLEGFALLSVGAVIFGLTHIYQGPVGILVTGLMGFAFGLVYVTTGSLLWAMALHALLDLKILLIRDVSRPRERVA